MRDVPQRFAPKKASCPQMRGTSGNKAHRALLPYVEFFFAEVRLDFCKKLGNVPYRSCPYRMYGDLRYGQYIVIQYPEYQPVLLFGQKRPIVVKNALDAACSS